MSADKKLRTPRLAVLKAIILASVLCAGLAAGCKDLFRPEGPEEDHNTTDNMPYYP
jgi:hypothetical protein